MKHIKLIYISNNYFVFLLHISYKYEYMVRKIDIKQKSNLSILLVGILIGVVIMILLGKGENAEGQRFNVFIFRQNYLTPALEHGLIERTDPDSPRSPRQRYRLTAKGDAMRKSLLQRRTGK